MSVTAVIRSTAITGPSGGVPVLAGDVRLDRVRLTLSGLVLAGPDCPLIIEVEESTNFAAWAAGVLWIPGPITTGDP